MFDSIGRRSGLTDQASVQWVSNVAYGGTYGPAGEMTAMKQLVSSANQQWYSEISSNVALFLEYNPGGIQRGGVGVLYSFPRRRESGGQADPKDKAGPPSGQMPQSGTFR